MTAWTSRRQRRTGLIAGIVLAVAGLAWCAPATATPPAGPPNILFVVLDDVGMDQMKVFGYGGASAPRTPNIDAIANAGIGFRNVWTMPECSPSRALMFEGRYPLRTNVFDAILSVDLANSQVSPYETTTPKVLAYSSAHTPYQQPPTSLLPAASLPTGAFNCLGSPEDQRVLSNQMIEAMDAEIGRVLVETGIATRGADGSLQYGQRDGVQVELVRLQPGRSHRPEGPPLHHARQVPARMPGGEALVGRRTFMCGAGDRRGAWDREDRGEHRPAC